MNKILTLLARSFLVSLILLSSTLNIASVSAQTQDEVQAMLNDDEFQAAVNWMYTKSISKYTTGENFLPASLVLREHAAELFSKFAEKELYRTMDQSKICTFLDIEKAEEGLQNSIINACKLNIFYGSQGMFYPNKPLTKAEAIVVLTRIYDGKQEEPDEEIWRKNYTLRAFELGISKETDPLAQDRPMTRYELALMLYRLRSK